MVTKTKTFEQLRKEQLSQLSDQLRREHFGLTGQDRFFVYPFEASIGKTYTLKETLISMAEHQPHVKTLVVSKFIDEGNMLATEIPNAKAINSESEDVNEDELEQYTVLIITHQKYKILCNDYKRRKKYIDGRHNLVIDEELNLTNMGSLGTKEIDLMESILQEVSYQLNVFHDDQERKEKIDLGAFYREIVSGIEQEKNKYTSKEYKFFYYRDYHAPPKIDDLKQYVEKATFTKNYIRHLEYKHGIKANKITVLKNLNMLKKFYNNPNVIVSRKKLYTYDENIDYFTLKNNIILDASAKFNALYRISDKFKVIETERIVDHSNWTIHICKHNSTAYHKHHNDNYYGDVMNLIKNNCIEDDKLLILGLEEDLINIKEDYEEQLEEFEYDMSNFQAMRGKNDWKDYNKCFIIHNPFVGFPYYVFQYMLYSGEELTENDIATQKVDKSMGFSNNPKLELLRKTDIASNIYQGLKRINRGMDRKDIKADVYIINNSEVILDMITAQLKNHQVNEIHNFSSNVKPRKKREQKGYNSENRKKNSKAKVLASTLNTMESGKYAKKIIAEKVPCNVSNLSKLYKDEDVKDVITQRKIEVKHQTIVIP